MVGHGLTFAFAHLVVRQQFAFVARERMVSRRADLFQRQCLGPYTRLEHVTVVGATEREIRTAVLRALQLFRRTQSLVCYLYRTDEEPCSAGLLRYT